MRRYSIHFAIALEAFWLVLLIYGFVSGQLWSSLALVIVLLFLPIVSGISATIGFFSNHTKVILFAMLASIVEVVFMLILSLVALSLNSLHLS